MAALNPGHMNRYQAHMSYGTFSFEACTIPPEINGSELEWKARDTDDSVVMT